MIRDVSWEFDGFIITLGHLKFAITSLFPKIVGLWLNLDLDCQSNICDGFGLDWQSKIIGLSNSLLVGYERSMEDL